jgi:hypothetical protein
MIAMSKDIKKCVSLSISTILFICPTSLYAETSQVDSRLRDALTAVNSAPLIVQQVRTDPDQNGQMNLDSLKIIQVTDGSSPYLYLGVYHRKSGSELTKLGIAGSNDLTHWTVINGILDTDESSQPDITRLSDGSYLVVYENDPSHADEGQQADPNFRIRHYASFAELAAGNADRQFDFENTLSSTHCAEGTPTFRKISYAGNLDNSTIELGFHYCNYGTGSQPAVPDSAAKGTLTNFRSWRSQDFTALNKAMRQVGVQSVGQMNSFQYQGNNYLLLEGAFDKDRITTFRPYLFNEDSGYLERLSPTTPGDAKAFSNPRLTIHRDANGNADGIIGTYFLPTGDDCVGPCTSGGEAGTYLFQQYLDSTLVDGESAFSPLYFRYNPVGQICTNGCLGVLLANRDLNPGSGTSTDIGGVSAAVGGGQRHIVYGPYITGLPGIWLTANFKMLLDSVANKSDHVARLEVVDATAGTVIANRELYRSDFHHSYVYSDVPVTFDWGPHAGHQVEFRVWTYDTSYMKVSAVKVYLASYTFFCPGDLSISQNAHSTGSSCAANSTTTNGNIVYGPYLADFPGGPATATYSIRSLASSASGSTPVANIDVNAFNSASGVSVLLASANISASQLDSSYRTFTLDYDSRYFSGNGWQIETRVNGLGKSVIDAQYTFVTPH